MPVDSTLISGGVDLPLEGRKVIFDPGSVRVIDGTIAAVDVIGPLSLLEADFNIAAHLVFTASSSDVSDVWVRGRRLVEVGQVVSVDVSSVAEHAQAAAEDLFARRASLPGRTPGPASDPQGNAAC